MNRRDAIKRLTLLMGGAVIGAESFLSGEILPGKRTTLVLKPEQIALLDEIGETIIPTTASPGAKSVRIGDFMRMMVNDCYDDAQQAVFERGLEQVDAAARSRFGHPFVRCSAENRTALLTDLDQEAKRYRAQKAADAPEHYFRMMKQLTLVGYFTSETGCTRALRYLEVPGAYRGSEPYKKGDRAWFVDAGRSL